MSESELETMRQRISRAAKEIYRQEVSVDIIEETISLDNAIHFEQARVTSTRKSILGDFSNEMDGWHVWVEYPEESYLDPYGTHYEDIGEFSHWDLAISAAFMKLTAELVRRVNYDAT